jgi:hypothetical protein
MEDSNPETGCPPEDTEMAGENNQSSSELPNEGTGVEQIAEISTDPVESVPMDPIVTTEGSSPGGNAAAEMIAGTVTDRMDTDINEDNVKGSGDNVEDDETGDGQNKSLDEGGDAGEGGDEGDADEADNSNYENLDSIRDSRGDGAEEEDESGDDDDSSDSSDGEDTQPVEGNDANEDESSDDDDDDDNNDDDEDDPANRNTMDLDQTSLNPMGTSGGKAGPLYFCLSSTGCRCRWSQRIPIAWMWLKVFCRRGCRKRRGSS